MRWSVAVRYFAGILGIAAAVLMSAPAQALPDCPTGQIDCTSDHCGPVVQGPCVPPTAGLPVPPPLPVDVQLGIGFGVGS